MVKEMEWIRKVVGGVGRDDENALAVFREQARETATIRRLSHATLA